MFAKLLDVAVPRAQCSVKLVDDYIYGWVVHGGVVKSKIHGWFCSVVYIVCAHSSKIDVLRARDLRTLFRTVYS